MSSLSRLAVLGIVVVSFVGADAAAIGPGDKLELASHSATIKPAKGFIETPISLSADGARLAYIVSNAAGDASVHIRDLASNKVVTELPIAALKGVPIALSFVSVDTVFVSVRTSSGDEAAAVVAADKVVRRFGPATRVRRIKRDGRDVVAIYRAKKKRNITTHSSEARDLTSGKRVGKRTSLRTDASGRDSRRGFTLSHWLDERLIAVGLKEGDYNRKADQRMPDQIGQLDFTSGKLTGTDISDLIAHRRLQPILKRHSGERRFIELAKDRSSLRLFEDGVARDIKLAEAINHYEPSSLVYRAMPDGALFFSVQIDPVHPDAARARRAVPAWIDLYELKAGETTANRRARLRPAREEAFDWIASSSHWVLLPKHVGFSRGGPRLEVIELTGSRPISKRD